VKDLMKKLQQIAKETPVTATRAGLAAWLLDRLRKSRRPQPRLALVERIALAPRQALSLVEAEGRRFLVATSAEGAPVLYPLDRDCRQSNILQSGAEFRRFNFPANAVARQTSDRPARVSW